MSPLWHLGRSKDHRRDAPFFIGWEGVPKTELPIVAAPIRRKTFYLSEKYRGIFFHRLQINTPKLPHHAAGSLLTDAVSD